MKRDWSGKLAAGKFDEIVDEAERWGLGPCLAEATSSELSSLADAARYTRRGGLAKQALLAQRRRFAGSAVPSRPRFSWAASPSRRKGRPRPCPGSSDTSPKRREGHMHPRPRAQNDPRGEDVGSRAPPA